MLDSVWSLSLACMTALNVFTKQSCIGHFYTYKGDNKSMSNDKILYEFSPIDHYSFNTIFRVYHSFEKEHPFRTQWMGN